MLSIIGLLLLNLLMLWGLEKELFWRQLLFWLTGGGLFLLGKILSARNLASLGKKLYFLSIAFLSLPLIWGTIIRGSSRWIGIAGFSIQPSELVKPLLILFFAWLLGKEKIENFKKFIFLIILIAIPSLLILIQPDLGSSGIIFATLMLLLFVSRPKLNWWALIGVVFILILVLGGKVILRPYQAERVRGFFNPYDDPLGSGYNLIQAQLAIGSGGFWGKGFGVGRQTQLKFLPEKHTDFVFAAIGEELGFLGTSFTLGFYFWLFYWMIRKTFKTKDKILFLFRLGIFCQLFLQTVINIAMNLQLFPIVGLPLPLVSYGGSSLISTLFSLGLFLT